MIAVGIVGFRKSGKTTLTGLLADGLEARGLTVAIAKHTHHDLDKPDTDTARLMKPGRTVAGLGEHGTMLTWGRSRHLADLAPLLEAQVLLVEGGKSLGWLPRILCLRDAGEGSAPKLHPALALACYGAFACNGLPLYGEQNIEPLLELILTRGFMLPGLDCGACGEGDCAGLAKRIVAGTATLGGCKALDSGCKVTVNGHALGLNPFTAHMLAGGIKGMLGSLKGYAPGEVVIRLK